MKTCPFCQQEIQDEAIRCRFCAESLVREPREPLSLEAVKLPNFLAGYILAIIFLFLEIVFIFLPNPDLKTGLSAFSKLLGLSGLVFWCVCLFKFHKALAVIADNCYPISPGKAVGFGFIPFFNLYWMFAWPAEVIHFVKKRSSIKTWAAWMPGFLLFLSGLMGQISGALWLVFIFGVLSYLKGIVKKSLAECPEPKPYKSKASFSSAAVAAVVFALMIPVFGILAAIAIPNVLRARMVANENRAAETLKLISDDLEKNAKISGGNYSLNQTAKLPGPEAVRGYRYSSKVSSEGYEIVAVPEKCYSTGIKNLKITKGGTITSDSCRVPDRPQQS